MISSLWQQCTTRIAILLVSPLACGEAIACFRPLKARAFGGGCIALARRDDALGCFWIRAMMSPGTSAEGKQAFRSNLFHTMRCLSPRRPLLGICEQLALSVRSTRDAELLARPPPLQVLYLLAFPFLDRLTRVLLELHGIAIAAYTAARGAGGSSRRMRQVSFLSGRFGQLCSRTAGSSASDTRYSARMAWVLDSPLDSPGWAGCL